jgi:hypothetical protein
VPLTLLTAVSIHFPGIMLFVAFLGEQLEAYIFMGPVHYQKLKHMLINNVSYVEAETYAH